MAFLLYLVVYCLKSCHIHCVTHACWCISIGSADELVRRNVYCFTLLSSLLWSSDGQWHRGESVYISHGQQHSLLWNGALIKLEAKVWKKKARDCTRKHVICKLTLLPSSLHVLSILYRWPPVHMCSPTLHANGFEVFGTSFLFISVIYGKSTKDLFDQNKVPREQKLIIPLFHFSLVKFILLQFFFSF